MRKDNKDYNVKTSYIFTRETMGMTLMLFSAIVLLMLLTGDAVFAGVGRGICTFLYGTFGYGSYLVVAALAYLGEWLAFEKKIKIRLKTALFLALTVFCFFMLFHAVSTGGYGLKGYGSYLSACYKNASKGWSGYTFGGVFSGLLVYPVAKIGGFVGAYIVFAVMALFCGYLTFAAVRRVLKPSQAIVDGQSKKSYAEIPSVPVTPRAPLEADHLNTANNDKETASTRQFSRPAAEEQAQIASPVADEKFSQRELGRKILFEKGEFAAESYRRNMIFNEDSYFNHPIRNDDDYLKSFSDGQLKSTKRYSEEYQDGIIDKPAENLPSSYVYGEKPVENLTGFDSAQSSVYSASEEYGSGTETNDDYGTNAYSSNGYVEENFATEDKDYISDEYSQSIRDDSCVEEEPYVSDNNNFGEQKDEPSQRVGFGERIADSGVRGSEPREETAPRQDNYDEITRGEEEKKDTTPDIRSLFRTDSLRGERAGEPDASRSPDRSERSGADLFDTDDGDVFSKRAERRREPGNEENVRRTERTERIQRRDEVKPEPVEEKPKHVWKQYVRPPMDLLDDYPENNNVNTGEIEDNKRIIVDTLEHFKIGCDISNVTIGPAITRYDVIIEDKLNIKRALGYREALAMALKKDNVNAYLNYSKGALSIEVPNDKRTTVGLKSVLASPKFINAKRNSLTFALGKNVEGEVACPDITKMPHLLVAGTTGSGKSICLSSLIISLLYKYGPEELRLILVDPKQVEFISYDKLPHLMINEIIYEIDKALKALNWAIKEMERRYSLFKDMTAAGTATKNLDEYNSHLPEGEEKLPKIVIILDEFGDLMLQAKKDIEGKIIKLVQKARACGIHLILATQRPSVDCITGLIKSNLPTRIGFKVNSFDDSRTIFDIGGAEKLLGMGDMYFRSAENPDLARIQGCFVDTHEVQKVTDFIKANNETYFDQSVADFINTVEQPEASAVSPSNDGLDETADTKIDDTFINALKYCVTSNQASVSMIQRRFPVGYIKACKIIDWMEDMNYITQSEGSKPRKVLLSKDEFIAIYGDSIDD